jgi:2-amino-4-hydroxy-6-hydroxymethyldihydropteridine diphosphokinase
MTMYRVFVGLGSNLGDRYLQLSRAADLLKKIEQTSVVWFSSVYETDPWGKADQPHFLNAVGELNTPLAPGELYPHLRAIELQLGRTSSERWGPREIDIDLLLYDGLVYADDTVTVPHPQLEHRRFVLVPFREIGKDVIHPVNGMTVEEMAAACRDQGRVVKTNYHLHV